MPRKADKYLREDGTFDVDMFLEEIYARAAKDEDRGLDMIFGAWYVIGDKPNKYDIMTEVLKKADLSRMSEVFIICIMACTFKYSKQVPEHLEYVKRAEAHFLADGLPQEEVNEILHGLREAGNYWGSMAGMPYIISGIPPED